MTIIAHCIDEISKILSTSFENIEAGKMSFSQLIASVREDMMGLSVDMVEDILAKTEASLHQAPGRKQRYRVQRKEDEKVISTLLGDVTLKRHYYQDKQTDDFVYLLDNYLELTPHQRIDMGLETEILKRSTELSYQKTMDSFDQIGIHSRQVVKNIVHKYEADSTCLPIPPKRQVDYLYIEADEDHVAHQDGKNREMRLVYVHEGYRATGSKTRPELQISRRFTGFYPDSELLWEDVNYFIESQYDTSYCQKIYLSGDGASWIKKGLDFLPAKTTYVLDPYHTSQAARRACVGIESAALYPTLMTWIREGQRDYLRDYFNVRFSDERLGSSMRHSLKQTHTYLKRHWDSIQRQKDPHYIGCSAEGHVSHWLSARLSSRPLGWSQRGSENMAKLRIFILNKGNIDSLVAETHHSQLKEKRIQQLDRRVSNSYGTSYQVVKGSLPILSHSRHSRTRKVFRNIQGI